MSEQNLPSLEEVQAAFARWRASGQVWRTPPTLRAQAVGLLTRHRIGEVTKALGVDHQRLSRWRSELSTSRVAVTAEEFVELPPARVEESLMAGVADSASLTLTRHAGDGSAISIQGQLSAAPWRWALALLREPGP